ncbi:MAG: PqqD family peptide modification chaperone [Anaerolineae bacterium]|nr:PqqD family peptide modification chaperone [Anaerolineae bacterium]
MPVPAPARVALALAPAAADDSCRYAMNLLRRKPAATASLPALYHYQVEHPGEQSRIHLRLDGDGHGTLIINANRVLNLNPTAARMAHLILEGTADQEIVQRLRRDYQADAAHIRADLVDFREQLDELIRPDGACPIHELGLETTMPFSSRPSAPYRMDLAVTYRCNNNCAHCYNARERDFPELDTDQWLDIIDQLWDLGIPHIVFTGGEPTLRQDLPELIAHAESNGQITGLNTNARRLADPEIVDQLIDAGLDHVQVTVESCEAEIHDRMVCAKGAYPETLAGLKNVLASRLYVMTNTTMLQTNVHTLPATLDTLADIGVPTVGLNALIHSGGGLTVGTGLAESELQPLLDMAIRKTSARGQRLIWYTPTQYCRFNPMRLNLGPKGCTAALYSMCIEPNGDVLPCQSYYHPLGHILTDDWDSIWNHELCVQLRERRYLPAKCDGCSLASECGGGCPLLIEGHRDAFGVNRPVVPLNPEAGFLPHR